MSYTPTTWANGDVVTATKLNKIEQALANAGTGFLVTVTINPNDSHQYITDKTAAEIKAAADSGLPIFVNCPNTSLAINNVYNPSYTVKTSTYFAHFVYDPDGYMYAYPYILEIDQFPTTDGLFAANANDVLQLNIGGE